MHVIITAIGSAGDVNPFIVIGNRLRQAGHRVDLIANAHFEEKVRRQGLNLLPLGTLEDYQSALNNPDLWRPSKAFQVVWRLVIQAARMNYELIEKNQTYGNTLLIGSSLAVGARLAQEKLGLPLVSVHLSPAPILSAHDTPLLPQWLPVSVKSSFIALLEKVLLDPVCKLSLNELRKELNLPPVPAHVIRKWLSSPELVICAFPDWFSAIQPDSPPNSFTSGFPFYTSDFDLALSDDLEEFLRAGKAPIIVTAGTAMAFARPFLEMGSKAAVATGNRAILVCDFDNQINANGPTSVLHVRYANFQALFKRAALVIHHGGIGTSAMALHCGTPQLIVPFAHDQFDNGARFEGLGVAKMVINQRNLGEWCRSIRILFSSDVQRNIRFYQEKLSNPAAGTEAIVALIERYAMRSAPEVLEPLKP